ncbi:protein involved in gliding motility SprE [Lutibacter oricola]|uniref:Protein involved in gliding motility SprE n=1 Tax=Lutibacter oricola TaxID=762486 RepID=A0A1H2RDJ6_9FLAO|nr:hypothetical protein [Lutibacter oricola]SDW17220.1 protein involved in gliding motility SprE [Lutibacter oricola]
MKLSTKIILGVFAVLFAISCSTKKDTFINRSFHSVTTKYNVLFNGHEAFRIGLEQLNENYQDNYWERLPIEPLKVEELALPGMKKDEDTSPKEFEKAEEKAVKAVQKHSMLIARQERNSQIDDAYLLLGKSRYYSKRFVPALEAFNYSIKNYRYASLINETRIWQAKTHIRLRNPEQAIENLKYLFKNEELTDEIKEAAHTAMAMAYVKTDSIQRVIEHLTKAVETTNNREQTARNLFILGQLYRENKVIDTSNIAFQKIIDFKKAPYKYKIHAQLEIAKNSIGNSDNIEVIEALQKLAKNRDNKPYLDEIYYQLGELTKTNDVDTSLEYYKKSLLASNNSNFQKELSYEAAGNLFFDKAEFITAGAYYDSILQIAKDVISKRVRRLKRKRNSLNEVINFENIAKSNDSIINIVEMSKEEQKEFFTTYVEKLKKEEEKQQALINSGSSIVSNKSNKNGSGGKWYFYNPQTVGFGQTEFRRVWGNRPLEDNWRLSDKTVLNSITNGNAEKPLSNEEKFDVEYYLKNIPSDIAKIDSIKLDRNNAYYNLGVIYKEQFKEPELAISKLESLLNFKPDANLELPAKYHLFKIYDALKSDKANTLKKDITTNFTSSKYAQIILNPNKVLKNEEDENTPEKYYAEVFYQYKDDKFDDVIKKSTEALVKYEGEPIVPKFELLKAYAIGKKDGLLAFKEALDFVAMNYPNTEEGKKAKEVISTIKTKI